MKLLLRHSPQFVAGLAFAAAPFASPAYADEQLVYVPLPAPCRVLDTRPSSGGTGPLTQTHGVYLFGTTAADISRPDQNGNPAGCNLPAGLAAISVNMNLLDTTASGNIATWSADVGATAPNIGTAVYNPTVTVPAAGQVQYNTGYTTIPVGASSGANAGQFYLLVANGQADMTINVVGYWLPSVQYMAGTGLALSSATFSVAPTYQLPQTCAANQVAQWTGAAWACGNAGSSYTAGTGLSLSGTSFSIGSSYQLPQGCTANEIPQWNGTSWICDGAINPLPTGTVNQTLRYNASNTLTANNLLQAFSDGGVVAGGTYNIGSIPVSGAGVRMMWYPRKAAFRAGLVTDNHWDDFAIGVSSIAAGFETIAKGGESVAFGYQTNALGIASFAMGYQVSAVGDHSTATGANSLAQGTAATALGDTTQALGDFSTAIGASSIASGKYSLVAGTGSVASGQWSVSIGTSTTADGIQSVAMGSNVSNDGHTGSFIFGDASRGTFSTVSNDADNQFAVVADGGTYFYSNNLATIGARLAHGSGAWTTISDRNAKTAVQPVNAAEVLKRVVAMPMNTWQYKTQDSQYRHMGPMAQDFYSAFHLGESDKGIDTVDADGVALAAIQGLHALLAKKDAQIDALTSELSAQRKEVALQRAGAAAQQKEIAELKVRMTSVESVAGELEKLKLQIAALRRSSLPVEAAVALQE